jgi:hypothetical protein
MAKTKAKKEKGHIIMTVYDDYSAHFEIDGDDKWLSAGLASGLEDDRFSAIVLTGCQTLLAVRAEKKEKKAASKKK